MAVKKTASPTKTNAPAPKPGGALTKAAGPKAAAKPKATGLMAAAMPKAETPSGMKATAPKKPAAPKAKPAPVKLTPTQTELLGKVHGAGEAGYLADKKVEHRSIEALRDRKLIKRGAKHKESGHFHYSVSNTGKKHVAATAAATPGAGSGGTPSTTSNA